jgi:hypothetical protein
MRFSEMLARIALRLSRLGGAVANALPPGFILPPGILGEHRTLMLICLTTMLLGATCCALAKQRFREFECPR